MIAIICMILPAFISVCLWQKVVEQGKTDIKKLGGIYFASVLVINILNRIVIKHLIGNEGDIFAQLNQSRGFALKYMVLACALALVIPFGAWIDRAESLADILKISAARYNILWHIFAVIYTIPFFIMNFIRIFDNNFWGDEAFTIRLARMSFGEMLYATATDVHPPLYYILVMGAYRLWGEHGWVFHIVSVLPYAMVLIFIHTVVWKKFGKVPAFMMITLTSVMSSAVLYNVEARMYSLAAMFVLFAFYGLYLILESDKKEGYILLVVASLGAAYSHYYAMMSVAIFYAALLVGVICKKIRLRKLVITYAVTIVGYLPWLMTMLTTFERTAKGFWMSEIPTFIQGLLYYYEGETWYSWLMLSLTFLFVMVLIGKDIKQAKSLSPDTLWYIWGVGASIGTFVLGELISVLIRPAFHTRYLYPVVAVMWLVLCVSITRFKRKRAIGMVLMVIILIVCIPNYRVAYQSEKARDNLCADTQEAMQQMIGKEDVILTNNSHFAWTIFDYYMPENRYMEIASGYDKFDSDITYWLVWSSDLKEEEMAWLNSCGYEVLEKYHNGVLGDNLLHVYQMARND